MPTRELNDVLIDLLKHVALKSPNWRGAYPGHVLRKFVEDLASEAIVPREQADR